MSRRRRRSVMVPVVAFALMMVGVSRGWGPLPALAPFLDPVRGVWEVARAARMPREAAGRIPELRGAVRVVYDDRAVPHIFAAHTDDAMRALGYVVARDRLFQMELQARAGAG